MKIKDLKVRIAMALTLIMIGAPVVKASAAETNSDEFLNMDEQQYTKFLTDDFHRTYGSEDRFKEVYADNEIREEVNGKTGEMRTMDAKTNQVIESYNYLEEVEERADAENMTTEEYVSDIKEQVEETKEAFQEQYGKDNTFKKIYEDNMLKEEVNGATGEYRETYKDSGEVETFNYFSELDQVVKNAENGVYLDESLSMYGGEYADDEESLYDDEYEYDEDYGYGYDEDSEEYGDEDEDYAYDDEEYTGEDGYNYLANGESSTSSQDLKQIIDDAKYALKEQYGTENEFKTVGEDDSIKEEINTATGEYKLTNKKDNTVDSYNLYSELDKMLDGAKSDNK